VFLRRAAQPRSVWYHKRHGARRRRRCPANAASNRTRWFQRAEVRATTRCFKQCIASSLSWERRMSRHSGPHVARW
jgi:hypothetical protein